MVKKMEATHAKLAEAYNSLKEKSDKSASDCIKARSEANEFKSLLSFKENQVNLGYIHLQLNAVILPNLVVWVRFTNLKILLQHLSF